MPLAQHRLLLPAVLVVSSAVAVLAITNESFWIDELMSAFLATADSFEDYKERNERLSSSDIQMPLYMAYLWLWQKFVGSSEMVLRLANVPWFLFGIYALWRFFRNTPRIRLFTIGFLLLSPFAWYYLNEARPYAMQLGGACAVIGCGMRIVMGWKKGLCLDTWDLVITAIGIVVMAGSSLLSIPWVGAFLVLFVFGVWRKAITFHKRTLLTTSLVTGVVLAGLAFYYGYTLIENARAVSRSGGFVQGLAFSFYELLGFGGLGPGRTDLRQEGVGVFTPVEIILVGALAAVHLIVGVRFLKNVVRPSGFTEKMLGWILLLGPPMVFMILLGVLKDFRVLGRHLTPLLPALLVYLGIAVAAVRRSTFNNILTTTLFVLLAVSCLSYRFAERHRKDDYRQAAAIARSEVEKGRGVLWIANTAAVPYYKLDELGLNWLRDPQGPSDSYLRNIFYLGKPDAVFGLRPHYVIMSKPDIHDPTSFGRNFILKEGFKLERSFAGFTLWSRQ